MKTTKRKKRCASITLILIMALITTKAIFADGSGTEDWMDSHYHQNMAFSGIDDMEKEITPEEGWISVQSFGAIPDDGVDDSDAINDAIGNTPVRSVLFVPPGVYTISSIDNEPALTFPKAITVIAYGAVFDYGNGTGVAVKLGVSGPSWVAGINFHDLHVIREYSLGGPAALELLGTGVLHSNVKGGKISDITIRGFAKGLHVVGDQEGNAYNRFEIDLIANNLHGIEIDTIDPGATGWCNENVFIGGRIFISPEPGFTDYQDTRYISIAKAENNHHRFIGMSLEGTPERKLDIAGLDNLFISNRYEGSNGVLDIEFGPESKGNTLMYGNSLGSMFIDDKGRSNNRHDTQTGLGTLNPKAQLHVKDPSRGIVKIEGGAKGQPSHRAILSLISDIDYRARGVQFEALDDETWFAGVPYTGNGFMIGRDQTQPEYITSSKMFITEDGKVGIGTVLPQGSLDVNGAIYQRGAPLHADYVFEPGYPLESIEEHTAYMKKEKHLKAVPKATTDENGEEFVEYGERMKGILEELEKAHLYIDQLNETNKKQGETLSRLTMAVQTQEGPK